MTATAAPGGPVGAPAAAPADGGGADSPAPSGADAGAEPAPAEGVVGPSPEAEDDGDPEVARRKAREILFEKEKTEEKKEEAPQKDEIALSKEWARVGAQEKRLRERQKAFLAESEEKTRVAEATEQKHAAREQSLAEREAKLNDPVAFLAANGWSKDQIVQWIQSDGKVDPEILVKQLDERHRGEIEALKREREMERAELVSAKRERELHRVEGELNQMVSQMVQGDAELAVLKRLVAKKPEKFEKFVHDRVGGIIREVFNKTKGKTVVDPRDALLYLQTELAELQLADPGQVPAVQSANPAAVEPSPITNGASSQRSVRPVNYDETDPEARRARALAIARGEIEAE